LFDSVFLVNSRRCDGRSGGPMRISLSLWLREAALDASEFALLLLSLKLRGAVAAVVWLRSDSSNVVIINASVTAIDLAPTICGCGCLICTQKLDIYDSFIKVNNNKKKKIKKKVKDWTGPRLKTLRVVSFCFGVKLKLQAAIQKKHTP
jgi:hypothetical protein